MYLGTGQKPSTKHSYPGISLDGYPLIRLVLVRFHYVFYNSTINRYCKHFSCTNVRKTERKC